MTVPDGTVDTSHLWRRWVPTVALWVSLASAAGVGVLWALNIGTPAEFAFGNRLTPLVLTADGVVFAVVGWMISTRRPRHAIGWTCLVIGLAVCLNTLSTEYAVYALRTRSGSVPAGEIAAWIGNWSWVGAVGLMGSVLVLHFPDGSLVTSSWRPVRVAAYVGMVFAMVYFAIVPGPLESIQWVENPFGLAGSKPWIDLLSLGFALLVLTVVAAAWSMRRRFRRTDAVSRIQIKWFAAAAGLLAATYVGQFIYSVVAGTLDGGSDAQRWFQTLTVAVFGALGGSVGIAILRYNLYDIDRIVSRTVSYSILVALLGALFALVVVGLPNWIPGVGDSPLFVAVGTLAVAAIFNPLRKRLHSQVDRRFNRSRYDAAQVMDEFAGSLRDRVDTGEVIGGWVDVIEETMQPSAVGVWVRS